jgi:hypothetical protein
MADSVGVRTIGERFEKRPYELQPKSDYREEAT